MGRPTKLTDEKMPLIEYMAKQGKTNREIAVIIGVCEKTIYNWRRENPEFLQSLKDWKEPADNDIERSLYERAHGYSTNETKVFLDKKGKIIEHIMIKHYPPDPTSMIFWLKNRKPDKWSDSKKEESDTTPEGIVINRPEK